MYVGIKYVTVCVVTLNLEVVIVVITVYCNCSYYYCWFDSNNNTACTYASTHTTHSINESGSVCE